MERGGFSAEKEANFLSPADKNVTQKSEIVEVDKEINLKNEVDTETFLKITEAVLDAGWVETDAISHGMESWALLHIISESNSPEELISMLPAIRKIVEAPLNTSRHRLCLYANKLAEHNIFLETINDLASTINDENFIESSKNIDLIANLAFYREIDGIKDFNTNPETTKKLAYLNDIGSNLKNFLLKTKFDELSLPLTEEELKKYENNEVEPKLTEDILLSFDNMLKYGLITSDHKTATTEEMAGDFNFVVNSNKTISLNKNGEHFKDVSLPENCLKTASSLPVKQMGTLGHKYLLLDLSSEYMGVFDENGQLYAFFGKMEIDSEKELKAKDIKEVHRLEKEIAHSLLPNDKKEEIIESFRCASNLPLRREIENKLGINLENLSIKEQIWFLSYLTEAKVEDVEEIKNFITEYGDNGIKTFFSMEYGQENGQKVIELAKQNREVAQSIFASYAEIINQSNIALDHLNKLFENNNLSFSGQSYENLLRNGKNLLVAACDLQKNNEAVIFINNEFKKINNFQEIESLFKEMIADLTFFNGYQPNNESFCSNGIKIIDKYLFDTVDITELQSKEINLQSLQPLSHDTILNLKKYGINISSENFLATIDFSEENQKNNTGLQVSVAAEGQFPKISVNSIDGIDEAMTLKQLVVNLTQKPDFMNPSFIGEKIANVHDKLNYDLREIENKTTDTGLSLNNLNNIFKGKEIKDIVDLGVGYGRLAIPLIEKGINVVGVDVSQNNLSSLKQNYNQTKNEGKGNLITINENFATFSPEQVGKLKEQQGLKKENDAAIIMWHTLNFMGSMDGQITALKNANALLKDDGVVVIEIPDRTFGPYKESLKHFHEQNPEMPPGTIIDSPPTQGNQISANQGETDVPRYFPSKLEMINSLKLAGFGEIEVETYFIKDENGSPIIKENMYIAKKIA